ncbi:P-loop containing nucleoside triphosphate hydrolase protein [Laetiporus sulphureus 93-53]|uniref:p-loop containing nucleoside triphosphate hydrolase protein n=1 Tax=Laetiporus sulphureus 93-53 TaxID=1314785 RepID=A0A165IEL6_9APHY|nr:P-loop containing nucleoside triphosphate hydrolase protein [Laetiporus sulphureus 93-53]KZT12967.1 P-loop containing nucleoside triphosphate hydrolase protein [Laetiporus sulphureus 93-53]
MACTQYVRATFAPDSSNVNSIPEVEVRVSPTATSRFDTIRNTVHDYLTSSLTHIYLPSTIQGWEDVPLLASSVTRIAASESPCPSPSLPIEETSLQIHVYQPSDADAFEEFASGSRGDGEEVMAASVCELPSMAWEGLWESLIYTDDIKSKLLDYIYATVVFSDADVDFNVVSWNRVVLLHGPPGTGKTSLCRALAQKLSIRLSHRYPHSRLLEINSHSLFSRWFSESGKLVQRLFSSVMEMVEDEDAFVVVLIDEVESLTAARAGAMAGTEPSDALRVVNALLTQLDKLKHKKNVLVMSTSNLAKAIDSAFVDRADIIQYVDLPPREAIYEILRTCLVELTRKHIVSNIDVPSLAQAQLYERTHLSQSSGAFQTSDPRERSRNVALRLLALSERCRIQGMSGRSLRRLPVLAHARYIGALPMLAPKRPDPQANGASSKIKKGLADERQATSTEVEVWLDAMERVIETQGAEKDRFHH